MSKTLDFAVQFTRFCTEHQYFPIEVAELIRLVNRAFKAGERDCNTGGDTADKPRRKVELQATKLGLKTTWPGLYPSFTKETDGRSVYLPLDR